MVKKLKLFEYAVLWHPNEDESKDGKKTKVLEEPKRELAENDKNLMMKIIRNVPAEYGEQLDQLEIIIHPF